VAGGTEWTCDGVESSASRVGESAAKSIRQLLPSDIIKSSTNQLGTNKIRALIDVFRSQDLSWDLGIGFSGSALAPWHAHPLPVLDAVYEGRAQKFG
jgi:hypothetical protein